jgi:hypothetical protein
MQRLKTISQMGIPPKYHCIPTFSRYDHSLGVCHLLSKLGATLEEQVAGLLHDISVPAFSHVIDFVFGNGKSAQEDFHDKLHHKFIFNSEIPGILNKHGISLNRITNPENYSLLERPTPALCADRVDYGLREFVEWLNPSAAYNSLPGLMNLNGEIVFNSQKLGFIFATNFIQLQHRNWGGKEPILRYIVFADAISHLVDSGEIKLNDFFGREDVLLQKIEKSSNLEVKNRLALLKSKNFLKLYKPKGEWVFKKFRYVDPKIYHHNTLQTLTSLNAQYKSLLEKERIRTSKGVLS